MDNTNGGVEDLGQEFVTLLGRLRRAKCPRCHNRNLIAIFQDQHVILRCSAPLSVQPETSNFDDGVRTCDYSRIFYAEDGSPSDEMLRKPPFTLAFAADPPTNQKPKRRKIERLLAE